MSGLEIELDLVPQRDTGMTPYEIMLSESQERMLLVAEKGREDEVFRRLREVGPGRGRPSGESFRESTMRVLEHGKVVAEIPNESLTDEAPLYNRPMERWEPPGTARDAGGCALGEKTRPDGRAEELAGELEHLRSSAGCTNSTTRWCRPTP